MEHSITDVYEMHVLVKGKVQGVGFRATTCYHAQELGLQGTVRNLSNGQVEIYAQGSKPQLKELMKRLNQETKDMEETVIEYLPINQPYEDFRIIY